MTDTETADEYHAAHLPVARDFMDRVGTAVLSGGFDQVDALVATLDLEEKEDLLVGLAMRGRVNALVSGKVAHAIRLETPDGEWGREVRKLAVACEVSDRTIHRWMSAYQAAAGLELTTAQANAAAQQTARQQPGDDGADDDFGDLYDDEEEYAAAGFTMPAGDGVSGLEGQLAMRSSVGEPWLERDSVSPSPAYENEVTDRAARRPGRTVIQPDDVWLAFTEAQITAEHPALGPSGGAAKSARARWDKMTREEPMELLEQLEMIHEGDEVPDELAQALIDAEDQKAIVPDEVTPPKEKKQRKPGGAARTPEGLMVAVRELHQNIVKLREEGGSAAVVAQYGSAVVDLQGLIHAAQGCLNKVRSAVEDDRRANDPAAVPGDGPGF